jgi:hypothetical protein
MKQNQSRIALFEQLPAKANLLGPAIQGFVDAHTLEPALA